MALLYSNTKQCCSFVSVAEGWLQYTTALCCLPVGCWFFQNHPFLGNFCCQSIPLEDLWSSSSVQTWFCKKLWCSCSILPASGSESPFQFHLFWISLLRKNQETGDALAFSSVWLTELCMLLPWRWVVSKISVLILLGLMKCSSARNGCTPEMAMLSLGLL